MKRDIYLTDEQYLDMLKRGLILLDDVDSIECDDSNVVGNKYTNTNVGLCNDAGLTTLDTALWPNEFPKRVSHKYRRRHHKCPLDTRDVKDIDLNGCFWTCMIFQDGIELDQVGLVKALYKLRIQEEEKTWKHWKQQP